MDFAIDAPAEPMVAGARHLWRNPQYIGTVSMATYISCTKIMHAHCISCTASFYRISYILCIHWWITVLPTYNIDNIKMPHST